MTTVPAHQIAADLLSAANYIDEFGLEQHDYGQKGGPACMGGALKIVIFGDTWNVHTPTHLVDREMNARAALLRLVPLTIGQWNDKEGRLKSEASAKLRQAAEAVFPTTHSGPAPHGSTETGLAYMEASARFDGHGAARTEGEPS